MTPSGWRRAGGRAVRGVWQGAAALREAAGASGCCVLLPAHVLVPCRVLASSLFTGSLSLLPYLRVAWYLVPGPSCFCLVLIAHHAFHHVLLVT